MRFYAVRIFCNPDILLCNSELLLCKLTNAVRMPENWSSSWKTIKLVQFNYLFGFKLSEENAIGETIWEKWFLERTFPSESNGSVCYWV